MDLLDTLNLRSVIYNSLTRAGFTYVDEVLHLVQTQGDSALSAYHYISRISIREIRIALRGRQVQLFDAVLTHDIRTSYNSVFRKGSTIRDVSLHHANRFDRGVRGGLWHALIWDENLAGFVDVMLFGDEIQLMDRSDVEQE